LFYNDFSFIVFRQTYPFIILVVFVKTTCYVAFTKPTSPKMGSPAVTPRSMHPKETSQARYGKGEAPLTKGLFFRTLERGASFEKKHSKWCPLNLHARQSDMEKGPTREGRPHTHPTPPCRSLQELDRAPDPYVFFEKKSRAEGTSGTPLRRASSPH